MMDDPITRECDALREEIAMLEATLRRKDAELLAVRKELERLAQKEEGFD